MLLQKSLDLSEKQSEAWHYLEDDITTEVFYGGAAGGGKSFFGCLWHIDRRLRYPGSRGLIGRAKIATLEQSTLITFFTVCGLLGYSQGVHYHYNSQKHLINWVNGSQTVLKDLFFYPSDPEFTSLGSTEYTDVFIDEGSEITLKAFDIINSRIRFKLTEFGLIPKILTTCNPSPGWIKDNYLTDPKTNSPVKLKEYQQFVKARVSDNPDPAFVKLYTTQLLKMHSEYDIARLLDGDWDAEPEAKNPFAFQFDSNHISDIAQHRPEKQLYISIDFNLNPFAVTFWHHWQDNQGYHFWGIDEAEIAQGSIPAMIDLIKFRYEKFLHSSILTGDAKGNDKNISEADNASHYLSLQRGLGLSPHQVQVKANPRHKNSRDDVNKVLFRAKKKPTNVHFYLNPDSMPNTIRDFRVVQCDAFGEIIKGKRSDLAQRADYIDTGRYFLNLTAKPLILKLGW